MDRRKVLSTVFVTVLLDLVGFGILIPAQPFLSESLGASPRIVTVLGATYSLMQFIFAPMWGGLSDRIGRRPVMLTSIGFGVLGYALLGSATSLPMLFAGRALAGFGNANLAVAQAVVSDVTDDKDRARGMGMLGAAFGLGFIIGPVIGGVAGRVGGLHAPAWTAGGLGLVNLLMASLWLRESHPAGTRAPSTGGRWNRMPWRDAVRIPQVGPLLLIMFVMTSGFAMMEQVLSLFVERAWGAGASSQGQAAVAMTLTVKFLVTVGITGAIVQGWLMGRIAGRFRDNQLALAGLCCLVLAIGAIPLTEGHAFEWLLLVALVMAFGSGLVNPTLLVMLSKAAPAQQRGGLLGVGQAASSLGRVVGPSVAGLLFEWGHAVPFRLGAACMAVCIGLIWVASRQSVGAPASGA